MLNIKSRQILVSTLIGALCLYSIDLFLENRNFSKTTERMINESRAIQTALDRVQTDYRVLLNTTAGSENATKTLRETVEALKKQNETIIFQIKNMETQFNSLREEKNYLEEMLINKTKQIDILKHRSDGSLPAEVVPGESVPSEIRQGTGNRDEELKHLNEQNKVLQEKLNRLFRTTNEKINEINVAKIALSETVSTAQKKIEDEWNTVNLGSVTTSAMPAFQNQVEEVATPREPKTEGHVLAINSEHGFVVIDIGKVDNLPIDAMLEVKKNGVPIATLSVLETRDVMAACNIRDIQDGQRIEINDAVSILR